ncbi:hypothetical protein TIFTF001_013503 [Ficus carica]|uniref:Uncharacterized protein n=1 Tax=Ficus carica TaxID=3494 RepID=A0AA88A127_FICCA|nr:hypothetical protein TIFTF001_013503 [Ficus carica]
MPLIKRHNNKVMTFSASLPDDVCGVFAGSGVCDWNDMKELERESSSVRICEKGEASQL